ncbi:saccharopine dehydrogenase family protein [Sporomusa termitida]|uniref:Lysine 6-dehydrogenase n=1 Tax=Sporomusa termitida TaxID=2377 RepID=A0A517DZ82_9FIRM|nr:saccharopine dehydrogenase C-terminal domain-containing protein [Sporomusa termitida]QDR82651.1 Lysine 6-dehydrogenase [Sporomusa termitida]
MKAVVLGAGMIGCMTVKELAKHPNIEAVVVVDAFAASVEKCVAEAMNAKVKGQVASLDVEGVMESILKEADVAIAALPHSLSLPSILAAIKAGCHLVDLVGSRYPEKAELDNAARSAGVLIVPGIGVAPGIANVLAGRGAEILDEAEEAQVYCGGIPRYPLPPLWYQVVFRLESLMGLFTRPALAMIDGKMTQLPALSELETCYFAEPVGECEAVITDAHSLGCTMKGKIKTVYEKTVRYKGHYAKMKVLAELGFLAETPVEVDGVMVSPRKLSMVLLEPQMKGKSEEDITVLRVVVTGKRAGKPVRLQWEMVDLYDRERQMTSMAKTTGFPAVIIAEWLAEGKLAECGVIAPEQLLIGDRFAPFIAELKNRGIEIAYSEE